MVDSLVNCARLSVYDYKVMTKFMQDIFSKNYSDLFYVKMLALSFVVLYNIITN